MFWVAVGILQLGESTLYAAGLGLMEACIKVLTNIDAFEEQVRITYMYMYTTTFVKLFSFIIHVVGQGCRILKFREIIRRKTIIHLL